MNLPKRLQPREVSHGTGRQSSEEEGREWEVNLQASPGTSLVAPLPCCLGWGLRDLHPNILVRTLQGTRERKGEGASASNHWTEQLGLQPRQY